MVNLFFFLTQIVFVLGDKKIVFLFWEWKHFQDCRNFKSSILAKNVCDYLINGHEKYVLCIFD